MKIIDELHAFIWASATANNCNSFFINHDKKILIDPGHRHLFGHVTDELAELSLTPDQIDVVIITHGHPDHIEGLSDFVGTSTLIAISEAEMAFIKKTAPHYGEALGVSNFEPDILLQEGDLEIGDLHFEVIHAPGHSPGSVCLYWPENKVLITGDVVFNQGIGRTDLPGGSGEQLKDSIRRLSKLDVEYLLPGHGDIVRGRDAVKGNFEGIESYWFAYL